MKFAYIILHYFSAEDTVECIESINNNVADFNGDEKYFVIIDNASPNDSLSKVKTQTNHIKNIHFIRSEENLGFAKGNNLGISYAKVHVEPEFYVVLNNDTVVEQKDFQGIVKKKYGDTHFHILGPDIVTLDGMHQNPGFKQSWSLTELFVYRTKRRIQNILYIFGLGKIIRKLKGTVNPYLTNKITYDVKNTVLHGACLIFSKKYIEDQSGFYDETFMYMEEDILKLICDKNNYLIMYTPDLEITHKEETSSKLLYNNYDDRIIKKNKRIIESTIVYENLLKAYNSK